MNSETLELLQQTQERLVKANQQMPEMVSEELLSNIKVAIDALTGQQPEAFEQAQDTISQMAQYYPQLVPAIDRKLLWLLGGNCLHFLTDDEITGFQQAEE